MPVPSRVLVIGPAALADVAARALPAVPLATAASPLDGLWLAGREHPHAVLLSLDAGPGAVRFVRSVRLVASATRVVLACRAVDEPLARRLVQEGADDYLIEPLRREELLAAMSMTPQQPLSLEPAPVGLPVPSTLEYDRLDTILRRLDEGPAAALQRIAELLKDACSAAGVIIRLDDLECAVGDIAAAALEAPIEREQQTVGRILLCGDAAALAPDVMPRLAVYSRLVQSLAASAREHAAWRELAWQDDLTGLRNRRYLERALDNLVDDASRRRSRITVLLFDIDDFKRYNDRFGHETGDELLREVATLLRRTTREHDVISRYGGDEFAVIFHDSEKPRAPGSQHPSDPTALAERFCAAIREHDFKCLGDRAPGPVTVSGGLANYPWDGRTGNELIRSADAALLSAKNTGKNRMQLAGQPPHP
jgi:diguanylate cyclase (GGDEF)-like protein